MLRFSLDGLTSTLEAGQAISKTAYLFLRAASAPEVALVSQRLHALELWSVALSRAASAGGSAVSTTTCISKGTDYVLTDTYGDGICCQYGAGEEYKNFGCCILNWRKEIKVTR
jgi:hypothetical protein